MVRWLRSPPWRDVTLWALDVESTGLDLKTDFMLSVGMVPIRRGVVKWGERYYSMIRPADETDRRLGSEAIRAHHILRRELESAPPLITVLEEVLRRLGDDVLLVHHAPVDVRFLKRDCGASGLRWPRPVVVDTVRLLLKLADRLRRIDPNPPQVPTSLARARAFLGFPPHVVHHALYDALATAELFLALAERLEARRLRQLT